MVSWSNLAIVNKTDNKNETVCFVRGGCLYQSSTRVVIKPDTQIAQSPRVLSHVLEDKTVCFVIDKNIFILKDETCTEIVCSISFASANFECFTISGNGKYVLLAGKEFVHCVDIQSKQFLTKYFSGTTFIQLSSLSQINDTCSVLCLGRSGEILRLSWLSTDQNDLQFDCQWLRECIMMELSSAAAVHMLMNSLKIVTAGKEMTLWSDGLTEDCIKLDIGMSPIEKIHFLNESSLICLTQDSNLAMFSLITFVCCTVWGENHVKDFNLCETVSEGAHMLILTKQSATGVSFIQLLTFPGFVQKCSFGVSSETYLVTGSLQLMYLEAISSEDNINSVRIQTIEECTPTERLNCILGKKRFEEAKKFAFEYCLDAEIVYKAEAKHYLEMLPQVLNVDSKSVFQKLLNVLNSINDIQFVSQLCLQEKATNFEQMKQLLIYTFNRLQLDQKMLSENTEMDLHIKRMLSYMETFEIINGVGSTADWVDFCEADLLDLSLSYFRKGKAFEAAAIWTRHFSSFKNKLTVDGISRLLADIPVDLDCTQLSLWLHHFVPAIITTVPESLQCFTEWARYLEMSKQWPKVAVIVVEDLFKLVTRNARIMDTTFKHNTFHKHAVQQLRSLKNSLQDILLLKETYHIGLTLTEYLQVDKFVVAHTILKKAHHNINDVLNGFLKEYVLKHNLNWDKMLAQHIKWILNNVADLQFHSNSAFWEEIVVVVINNMKDVHECMQSILSVLEVCKVPWSSTVDLLAEKGLCMDHPLSEEIRKHQRLLAMKVVFRKYNFSMDFLKTDMHSISRLLICNIFKQKKEGLLEDALLIAQKSLYPVDEVYMQWIDNEICSGEHLSVLHVLHKLDPETLERCLQRIVYRIQAQECSEISYDYMNILCSFCAHHQDEVPAEEVKNIYQLRIEFGIKLTLSDYCSLQTRAALMKTHIKGLIEHFKESDDMYNIVNRARRMARLFNFSPDDGLLEFYEQIETNNSTSIPVDIVINFLVKWLGPSGYKKGRLLSVTQQLVETVPELDHQLISSIASLAKEAATKCDPNLLLAWLNIFHWADLFQCSAPENRCTAADSFRRWNVTPLFQNYSGVLMKKLNVNIIRCLFSTYQNSMEKEDNLKTVIRHVPHLTQELESEQADVFLITLLVELSVNSMHFMKSSYASHIDSQLIQAVLVLLQKVVCANQCDVEFVYGLLCSLNVDTALQWLYEKVQTYKQDYRKLMLVSKLGAVYATQNKLQRKREEFSKLVTKCKWALHFLKLGISYKHAFVSNHMETAIVLQKIAPNKKVDIAFIQEFCSDFKLDLKEQLCLYLETLILSWEPQFHVENNSVGETEVVIKNFEKTFIEKCTNVANKIQNRDILKNCLSSIWKQINYYHHEMYICIAAIEECTIKAGQASQYRFLLLFLQSYKRLRAPQQDEIQKWLDCFPESYHLPKISEWRLPFLPLIQCPWKILKSELNLETYGQWLKTASILKLDKDAICSVAIKNSVGDMIPSYTETLQDEWHLQEQCVTLFRHVEQCINQIQNMEIGAAAHYHVFNCAPLGADKVKAAKACYLYTKCWSQKVNTVYSLECLKKVRKNYLHFATKHVLYHYKIGIPKYFKLLAYPYQLITTLYQDLLIVESERGALLCPDINNAAKEIADLHNIELSSLHKEILKEWLIPPLQEDSIQENTVNITSTLQKCAINDQADEENHLRACYILKWNSTSELSEYLVRAAFGPDCESNVSFRLKALYCLFDVFGLDHLKMCTAMDDDMIICHMQVLKFIFELQHWGFIYSVRNFVACNKLDLVHSLLAHPSFNPRALLLIVQLCLKYGIYDVDVWEPLLNHMTKMSMVQELENTLLQLAEHGSVHLKVWNYVLFHPFLTAESPPLRDQLTACLHSMELLQSCPLLSRVDLLDMGRHCLRLQCPHLASVLLPLLHGKQRDCLKKEILDISDISILIKDIKNLSNERILIVPKILEILQEPIA